MRERMQLPRRRRAPRPFAAAACFLLIAALGLWRWSSPSGSTTEPASAARPSAAPPASAAPDGSELGAGPHRVARVVDGDTLVLEGGARVRLIGVDTPESVKPDSPVEPFGPEAADFTRRWIAAAGGRVTLEFDTEPKDRYGRHLAYVWVERRMLNEELLRAGLGSALLQHPYSEAVKDRFRAAAAEARAARRGIWSQSRSER